MGKTIPVGWVVGWLRNAGNKANLSPASAGTWAELGKNNVSEETASLFHANREIINAKNNSELFENK